MTGRSLLIAVISGRGIAAAARRAGLQPLVVDFFADADTRRLAQAVCRIESPIGQGFRWETLRLALGRAAQQAESPILGCVVGAGFEDRPELLSRIAERWPLLGNDAETVHAVKAPEHFFAELARMKIPHPRTVMIYPNDRQAWLAKRQGGAGGGHISCALPGHRPAHPYDHTYYQELIEGRSVSALFIANGLAAHVLGFSEQWTAPAGKRRWRYGGAAQPANIDHSLERQMRGAVERLGPAFGLVGLGSADFILRGGQALLLEINPRPGATLDVFDGDEMPLLALHLDAVIDKRLSAMSLPSQGAAASGIVYAPRGLRIPQDLRWPRWAADRPHPGERIDKQRPICTVGARARTASAAKRLVEGRTGRILAALYSHAEGDGRGSKDGRERRAQDGVAERQ